MYIYFIERTTFVFWLPSLYQYFQMVELVRGSCVYLYERQLNLVTESAKTMTALARQMIDVFFPLDKQVKSNLSGENGLQKLNKTIVDTIICKISCKTYLLYCLFGPCEFYSPSILKIMWRL